MKNQFAGHPCDGRQFISCNIPLKCFGNLKETLIEQGLELIHEEGIEKFSLRKAAKKVGVSAAVCYNHFGNIDELLIEADGNTVSIRTKDNSPMSQINTGIVKYHFEIGAGTEKQWIWA